MIGGKGLTKAFKGAKYASPSIGKVKVTTLTFTKKQLNSIVKKATHNPNSKTVTLGKWELGYVDIAKGRGDTYFDLGTKDWNNAEKSWW